MLCVDTKKKELLGRLHRPGQCYSTDVQYVYDHDFRHLANALLVPHGVYDYFDNAGFMTLGTSRETSAFVCDAIALAWEEDRQVRYPDAQEIVLTLIPAVPTPPARCALRRILDKVYHIGRICSDTFRGITDHFIRPEARGLNPPMG